MKTTAIKAWIASIALVAGGYGVIMAQEPNCSCEHNTSVSLTCTASLSAPEGTTLPNERLSDVRVSYPELHAGIGSQGAQPLLQRQEEQNPLFFFEERANWPALGISQPRTAWEYAQRGIYRQDERENIAAAVADYLKAEEDSNGRILIVESRLAYIALKEGERLGKEGNNTGAMACFDEAIERFCRVLEEAPDQQGVHFERGEAYQDKFKMTDPQDAPARQSGFDQAMQAFQCELKLAPNSQRTHFALAELFMEEGCKQILDDTQCRQGARTSLDVYLRQARWHSDTQPIRILKAQQSCGILGGNPPTDRPGCQ